MAFNEFQDPFPPLMILQKKLSAAKTYDTIGGVCSASCHLWRNGWADELVVVQALSPLLQPSLDLEPCSICLAIKPNQTKQAKASQQQKVPKQSNAIVKF